MIVSFVAGAAALQLAGSYGYLPVLGACVLLVAMGTALMVSHQRRHATAYLNAGEPSRQGAPPVIERDGGAHVDPFAGTRHGD